MSIDSTLQHIKDQIGLELTLDDHFAGLRKAKSDNYFNVDLGTPVFCSREYDQLIRLANYSSVIDRVEPNGHQRLAIFLA